MSGLGAALVVTAVGCSDDATNAGAEDEPTTTVVTTATTQPTATGAEAALALLGSGR